MGNSTSVNSDSSTSSSSEAEEIKQYEIKSKVIKPIMGMDIVILDNDNNEVLINDNFEITMLRLIHCFFSQDGLIHLPYLDQYGNDEIKEFFMDYPGVFLDSEFYKTEAGICIRKKWAQFMSNREYFDYKKNKCEMISSMKNFYSFFKNFFNNLIDEKEDNEQNKLNKLYEKISFDKKIEIIYSVYQKIDTDYANKSYIQNFYIDGVELYVLEFINYIDYRNNKTVLNYSELRLK